MTKHRFLRKTFLLTVLVCLFNLFAISAIATTIEGNGKYKGKELTTDGFKVRCGWQPWMSCWSLTFGPGITDVLELGNGDLIPLELNVNPDNGWDPFNYSESSNSIDVGSLTVRPMYKTQSNDPEDANCLTCFDYIYLFPVPQE
ncbi:MAG: hypothetical protein K1X81_10300 [Bacteroidia bacterium]|nr:hypothetical protein [Bacteroidia bacterium]